MTETRSTCPYCGVGCGVIIESDGTRITGVRGDPDHPANFGRLCTKGSTLHLTATPALQQHARLQQPLRRATRDGALQPIGWDDALDEVATRFAATVQAHGADSVGLYLSGQLLTEDYYVFNKLGKGLLGTNNVDTNSRLCMSSAVAGYKQSLGADAPPACYDDIARAQHIFVIGSNMAWAHPVLFRRLEDARRANPQQKLVVIDPRRTETADAADLHLALLPGTDVVLFHAMLHVMLWEGRVDLTFIGNHTTGFEALRDRVREFTPAHAATICGVKADDIVTAARWFAGDGGAAGTRAATLSLYCQGLNQSSSGTDKNSTLINLHLACGQIGKPGAGPLSLTGQPNAMGGREVGALANQLSAHRDLANPVHRAEVAALWGLAEGHELPARPGKSAIEMFQAAADGEIRALWIACTNPAQSMPDQATVRRALQRCEFVVLQEAYAGTATMAFADIVLPASSWGEKEGTVTNSERRISRVRAAIAPPGAARADWAIAVDVARRIERHVGRASTLFPYTGVEQIWNEHRDSTRGRDLDITGLDYARLDTPQQWPHPAGAPAATSRLYADGRFATADGRARFVAPAWRPTAEVRDARHPVSLTTGRLRDQWHGMSRTGLLGRLYAHTSEPALQMHPQELARRRWRDGDLVRVTSRRGQVVLPVRADDTVAPAQAFVAMHWGDEVLGGATSTGINAVTCSATCAQSKQPELKHAAVAISGAQLPWRLSAAAWLSADTWIAARDALRSAMRQFDYASCVPFGREPDGGVGLLLRGAHTQPLDVDALTTIEHTLGIVDAGVLRYADVRAGQRRAMQIAADGNLSAFLLAGDDAAADWVLDLLQQRLPAAPFGRALLASSRTPPQAMAARRAQICACHDVSEAAIVEAAATCDGDVEQRLQTVQGRLRCGTECGSCLPAVRTLVRRQVTRQVSA